MYFNLFYFLTTNNRKTPLTIHEFMCKERSMKKSKRRPELIGDGDEDKGQTIKKEINILQR